MPGLANALTQARVALADRYPVLVDTTEWSLQGGRLQVRGGVLVASQADLYQSTLSELLGLEAPRPTLLSALDANWTDLTWVTLPRDCVASLHRNSEGDDLQTQWTGPAAIRHFTDIGSRSLVQLPDGTLGWTAKDTLLPFKPTQDPWAELLRAAPGESKEVAASTEDLLAPARSRLGRPYLWGGNTEEAADCSGLVQSIVFRASGLLLPKNTKDQRALGLRVSAASIQPGDLVFVRGRERNLGHVGLALPSLLGSGVSVIHSCLTKNLVLEEPLEEFITRYRFTGARRPVAWAKT